MNAPLRLETTPRALPKATVGVTPGAAAAPPAWQAAPAWRREPYRLLFPLGVLLLWAGVGHWVLLATLGVGVYSGVFHSIAQVQGFMMCFAVGFLFTAIPRRTGTAAPAAWQMAVALGAPVLTTAAAYYEAFALAETAWLALVAVVVGFAVRRFLSAGAMRRPPNAFVWVPLAFLIGVVGAVCMAAFGILGRDAWWLHELGKGLLLQGMFTGLVLGVGSMVLPLVTVGDAPADGGRGARDHLARAGHVAAAGLLAWSFWLELDVDARLGLALRAAVCLTVLLAVSRIWRRPRLPGWHRWLVWVSAWCLPLGYALAAAFPLQKQAGLHVVFVGCFGLMALAVGLHVTLAHGGHERLVRGRPWQVPVFGALIAAALAARLAMVFDPARLWLWMGVAAGAFVLSTVAWAALALPRLRPAPSAP